MSAHPLQKFAWLSILTSVATITLKFAAFWLSNSISLLSDAIESLVNLTAGLIALWALWLAGQPADEGHAFGHQKAEYFSSGAEGLLILGAALSIIGSAIGRMLQPAALEQLGWGLLLSFVAAACNFVTARILLTVGRGHDSITLEADAQHLMTDVWTSIGIGVGLLLVLWAPSLAWLDPLLAVGVGGHIAITAVKLLRRSADGLMDASLPAAEIARLNHILDAALAEQGRVLSLRTRKSGSQRFIEASIGLPSDMSVAEAHRVCDVIEAAVERSHSPPPRLILHVEPLPPQSRA